MADAKQKGGGAPAGAKGGKPAGKGGPPAKEAKSKPATGAAAAPRTPRPADYKPRMKSLYEQEIRKKMAEHFGYANPMRIPRLEKIVLNMGVGEAVNDRKKVENASKDLAMIAGQRPVITRARKSIATYKVRENMALGAKVTLRGDRMWEFLDRLISIALPRIRDFRGLNPNSFDGRGNYSIGVREQIIFPEIDYDSINQIRGLDVAITTTAETDEQARALLLGLGLPLAAEARRD